MIDRALIAEIARRAIQVYVDAIHTCEDLAECQTQAVLVTVDEFTPSACSQDIERCGCEVSDVKQVLNRLQHPPAVEIARFVRAFRQTYAGYLAGDADAELPRYIREEILRPYGQEGGTGDREIG